MWMHPAPFGATFLPPGRARLLAATVLHGSSVMLGRLAHRLLQRPAQAVGEPVLEFYAQAGAPEGALYVDGVLVGQLRGITRL